MITVFLLHLKRHLINARYMASLPYTWDSANNTLKPVKSLRVKKFLRFSMISQFIYAILQLVLTAWSGHPLGKKLLAMVFTSIYFCGLAFRWNVKLDLIAMHLLNTFLKFEPNYVADFPYKKTATDRILGLLLPLIVFSCWVVSLGAGITVLLFPCIPPFLGSMLPTCRSNIPIPPGWVIRILLAFIDAVMLQQVCISAAFYLTQVLIGAIVHLWNYLSMLSIRTQNGINGESHQNFIMWYKQLQILTVLSNSCNQKRIFPAAALGLPSIEFFTFFVCIKLHNSLGAFETAFFFLIFLNVVAFNMTVFLAASKVFSCSVIQDVCTRQTIGSLLVVG
ncbi:hypothetical protein Fcan01_18151 [Folsomia candida]|uniref:Uncharacterized protein n=1 Tax=Folsomia candida TaxID=158441 RepID=A0A226DN81_FOLCA|nr:hypothetical protein Fcan01_18151 [Folsomia candida]